MSWHARTGVEIKQLGNCYDHPGPEADLRIRIVRLTGNNGYEFTADRAQIAWSTSAGLIVDGLPHPRLTCLYSPLGSTTASVGSMVSNSSSWICPGSTHNDSPTIRQEMRA